MAGKRPLLVTGVHVAGLWALAVVQPLLDVVGRAPEFFVAHRAGPSDILLLLGVLLVLAPLVPVAVIALAGVPGSRVRSAVTATIITVLVGLVAVQVMTQVGVTRWTVAVPPAVAAGAVMKSVPLATLPAVLTPSDQDLRIPLGDHDRAIINAYKAMPGASATIVV
jgi:hypothetical protein